MSYYGSEIDQKLSEIIRGWAQFAYRLAMGAFVFGLLAGVLVGWRLL